MQRKAVLGIGANEGAASDHLAGGICALGARGLKPQYGLMRTIKLSHGELMMLGAIKAW